MSVVTAGAFAPAAAASISSVIANVAIAVAPAALVGNQIVRLTVGNLINDSGLVVWCASLTVLVALALAVVIQCRHELMRTDLNNLPPSTFDEWVDYCFTRGYSDFYTDCNSPDFERIQEISAPYLNIDPCEHIIDRFLAEREVPQKVREYALAAREGGVL